MLTTLHIKNFALIEEIELEFGSGLNVITGETGTGKSILIGALSMLLGERASTDNVRAGTERAVIEGQFTQLPPALRDFLTHSGIEIGGNDILIRREIPVRGQGRCFVNDQLVTNAALKTVGDWLVDLHGQHEHQSLLRTELHLDYLDSFADLGGEVETLKSLFQEVTSLHHKIEEVTRSRDEFRERYDVLVHQLKEIQSVSPKPKEDEELLQAERIAGSSEKLFELSEKVYAGLYEQESSVLEALAGMKSSLDQLREIDGRFTETLEQFQTATIMLEEIARQIGEYRDRIHFDPGALEGIRERLVQIQRLKKKYGTLDDTLAKQQELSEQIRFHDNFDNELQQLRNRLAEEGRKYAEAAQTVRTRRRKAALALDKRIVEEMKQLGMSHARFSTAMVPLPSGRVSIDMDGHGVWIGPKGVDDVAFLISTNAGEEVKPLIKVASGGEISRIMLSLKAVMAASDNIPTLVFDEIDVGISGRIAQTVGRALHTLGRSHQVICITHLPQIASMSERHFSVAKTETGRRTVTQIRVLSGEEKIHEIAKLLGGETVTETALKNARELVASTR